MRDADRLTEQVAARLVAEQFPQWSHLPVELVRPGGHDNRTFRLGETMTVRLPTDEGYVPGELKEHEWLGRLAPVLPLPIPEVIGRGRPDASFRRPWSIRRWIPGETASPDRIADFDAFARDLAAFVVALQGAETDGAPAAGPQSFFRGAHPSAYDDDVRRSLEVLQDDLDVALVEATWDRALDSEWTRDPVWFHGDIAAGNLLVADGRLAAVIDFGTSGVGDPACDAVVAWTLLPADVRSVYREAAGFDDDTWERGRGWALWKALILLAEHRESNPALADDVRMVVGHVLAREDG